MRTMTEVRAKVKEMEARLLEAESKCERLTDDIAKIRAGERSDEKPMKIPKRPKPLKDLNVGKDPE